MRRGNPVRSQPELPITAESMPDVVSIEASAPTSDPVTPEPAPVEDVPTVATVIHGTCPVPGYPRLALNRGWQGTVVVTIDVRVDGTVSDVRVVTSSGHKVLDNEV